MTTHSPKNRPPHPGDVLAKRMDELNITAYKIGNDIGGTPVSIYQLIREKSFGGRTRRDVTAPMALVLGKYFGDGAEYWMGLQVAYDLDKAVADEKFAKRLAKVQQFVPGAADQMLTGSVGPSPRRLMAQTRKSTSVKKSTATKKSAAAKKSGVAKKSGQNSPSKRSSKR